MTEGAHAFSPEEAEQIKAVLNDRIWRLCNLYWIQNQKGEKVKFRPNRAQKRLLREMHYLNVILKARQLGFSTFIAIFILDVLLFNSNQSAGIVDKTMEDAKAKLDKMRFAYDHLDDPDDEKTAALGAALKDSIRRVTDSATELAWNNGSSAVCGVSLRGGTYQYLHVSEYGYTAHYAPERAREIKSGAFNTVAAGRFIFVESTHEGGRGGDFYDLCKSAQETDRENLSALDFRFHFEPWWSEPSYVLPAEHYRPTEISEKYFRELAEKGIELTTEQKAWYWKKRQQQGDEIFKEFPSTSEECFKVVIQGAIYGQLVAEARAQGRITDFAWERGYPVHTFWDIGFSDTTAIWAVQFAGRDLLWIDHYEAEGETPPDFVRVIDEWRRKGYNIGNHYLPHDADYTEKGSGKSYRTQLVEAGIPAHEITVVPRTPDRWIGINYLRNMFPKFWFRATPCERGIECLEAYRKRHNETMGRMSEEPLHDWSSNSADAARTLSEAHMRGMIRDAAAASRGVGLEKPRVVSGVGSSLQSSRGRFRKPRVRR